MAESGVTGVFFNLGQMLQQGQCATELGNVNCMISCALKSMSEWMIFNNGILCISSVFKYKFRSKGTTNEICPVFSLSPKGDDIFNTQGCSDHINVTLMVEYKKALQKQ